MGPGFINIDLVLVKWVPVLWRWVPVLWGPGFMGPGTRDPVPVIQYARFCNRLCRYDALRPRKKIFSFASDDFKKVGAGGRIFISFSISLYVKSRRFKTYLQFAFTPLHRG